MKDFIAPMTATGIIFGGLWFLYATLGLDGVEDVRLIVSGLMGSAALYLFGDAMQKRANDAQPTVTTTTGPPAVTTVQPETPE